MALTRATNPTQHAEPSADYLVVVAPASLTPERQLYSAILDGEMIVTASRDPETDAARALVSRRYVGTVQFAKAGRPPYTRPAQIALLALTVTRETAIDGLQVRRYVPLDGKPITVAAEARP